MDFTEQFIQENELNETQIANVKEFVSNHISELKKDWDGRANENAERILEGASKSVEQLTGIQRERGQKVAEYISSASENFFKGQRASIERSQKDLEEKLKSAGSDESLKKEYNELKSRYESLQQKEAMFADYEENDYKGKYTELNDKLSKMEINSSFDSVKPAIPEGVNKYEFDYKWNELKNDILGKYNIKLVDGVAMYSDKENEYKNGKLADLVSKDSSIAGLVSPQQKGIGSRKNYIKIQDVPFDVPENATAQDRQKAIREYLASKNVRVESPDYSKQFADLNAKILAQKTA